MSGTASPVDLAPVGRSPWRDSRVRFLRNRAAVASVVVLGLITLACVFGPMLLPNAFDSVDWNLMSNAPTRAGWHLFGTDELGRDLLVRTLIGGRISLMVGLLATLVSVSIGVVWGASWRAGKKSRSSTCFARGADRSPRLPWTVSRLRRSACTGRICTGRCSTRCRPPA